MYKDKKTEELKPQCGAENFIGFCVDLTKRVAETINVTYDICLVKDQKYGSMFENGSWNGMIGELTRDVSHLA